MGGEGNDQKKQKPNHPFAMEEHYFNDDHSPEGTQVHTRSISEEDFVMIDNNEPAPANSSSDRSSTTLGVVHQQSTSPPSSGCHDDRSVPDAEAEHTPGRLEEPTLDAAPTPDDNAEQQPVSGSLEEPQAHVDQLATTMEEVVVEEEEKEKEKEEPALSLQEEPATAMEEKAEELPLELQQPDVAAAEEAETREGDARLPAAEEPEDLVPLLKLASSEPSSTEPPAVSPVQCSGLRCFFDTVINPASPSFSLVLNTGVIAWVGIMTLAFRCIVFGCEQHTAC